MRHFEKYTGAKTYMTPAGTLATPAYVAEKYPATATFAHIVETDANGEVMFALQNLSAMRTRWGIDPSATETEATEALQEAVNAADEMSVSAEPSAEERIAAALEAQVMLAMPDAAE